MPKASTNSAQLWSELVKTALLGTDRIALPELGYRDNIGALLSQLDHSNREASLLAAAAVVSLHRQCGTVSVPSEKSGFPLCDTDPIPRCSSNTASFLKRILQGQFSHLLPEFFSALAESGHRLSEEVLPDALDAGRKDVKLRNFLVRVIGRRGEWLASLNEEWDYVAAKADVKDWETASRPSRVSILRELRKNNPSNAIGLLTSTWKQDGPEDRLAFMEELQIGLHSGDEEFVESALDDRRKEVRRKAAELLVQLPESKLVRRMIDRIRLLVAASSASGSKLIRALTRQSKIQVTLPEACDESMRRDGVELTPPQGMGEKAWWLGQMVACVPITFWDDHLSLPPTECVRDAEKTDYSEVLLPAWAKATKRGRQLEWAQAILEYALGAKRNFQLLAVVEVLPPTHRDPVVIKLLSSDRNIVGYAQPGFNLLQYCPGPWTERLGRALLEFLQFQVKQNQEGKLQLTYIWFPNPEQFAMNMPITLATEAQEMFANVASEHPFSKPLHTFLEILQFRSKMLKEIHK
jgi:Family of unknown function (DUF5691)